MFNQWRSLKSYIHVFNHAIPTVLCDEIINYYKYSDEWKDTEVHGQDIKSHVNKNTRHCTQILLTSTIFEKSIHNVMQSCLGKYFDAHSEIENYINGGERYVLLRYENSNFYKKHIDSHCNTYRTISISLCLNDNYKGGEFSFFNNGYKVRLKKGDAIMFPSNFMYPHAVTPVQKGVRYSIVSWYN
jgi:predicted 2-oxoglutarate/Fe(II)-dependent dioxygenase YbiX